MSDQSHRKADPAPTKAERTETPTTGRSQDQLSDKFTRDKGRQPEAQSTKE